MVPWLNSLSSGSPASCGCWPIMVTTTELKDRAGASTKSGANRAGSRRTGAGTFRGEPVLMDLRPHHRPAGAIGVDPFGQRLEIVGDERVAQIEQPGAGAFAECRNALGLQLRPVALLERQRGFFDQPEQACVSAGRQPDQSFTIGAGPPQARRQPLAGLELSPRVAALVGEALGGDPWPQR